MKGIIAVFLATALIITMSSCSNDHIDDSEELEAYGHDYAMQDVSDDTNSEFQEDHSNTEKLTGKTYEDILIDMEDHLRQMGQSQRDEDKNVINEPVAFYDLNGDGSDEMFLLDSSVEAVKIYTCENGNVEQLEYMKQLEHKTRSSFVPGFIAGGPSGFMFFSAKTAGQFYILNYSSDSQHTYSVAKLEFSNDSKINVLETFENLVVNDPPWQVYDDYYINGMPVSQETGAAKFKALSNDFRDCIIWEGYLGEASVKNKIVRGEEYSVSVDEAFQRLSENKSKK